MDVSAVMPSIRALPVITPIPPKPAPDLGPLGALPPGPTGQPMANGGAHGAMPPAPTGGPYSCGIINAGHKIDTLA
jgi:hypothetical protein